jgi:membrane-associated phospholipid phosphatase
MSLADGLKATAPDPTMSRLQWVRANIIVALVALMRAPRPGAAFAWRASSLRLAVGAIVVVIAVLVTMAVIDVWAIQAREHLPHWLTGFFGDVTDSGKSGWFLVPSALLLIAIALLASPALPRMSRLVLSAISARLGFVFLAVGFPGLVVTIVKRIIGRARPLIEDKLDPFFYRPLGWNADFASLPSGHATNAFAAAVALGALWPKGRPLFWTYALIIAVSRVVVAAHHPSDVLAGAVAGILGAVIVRDWFAARGLGFVPDGHGGVRRLPGPSFARIKRVTRQLVGQ